MKSIQFYFYLLLLMGLDHYRSGNIMSARVQATPVLGFGVAKRLLLSGFQRGTKPPTSSSFESDQMIPKEDAYLDENTGIKTTVVGDDPSPYTPQSKSDLDAKAFWISEGANAAIDLTERINLFLPKTPGTYPVIVFFSGMGSNLPDAMYSDLLLEFAAKQSAILVGLDFLFTSNPLAFEQATARAAAVLRWVLRRNQGHGLTEYMRRKSGLPRGVYPNAEQLILAGHSSGCKIILKLTQLAEFDQISALMLLDPVDGDPFGIGHPSFPLTKQIKMPVLFVTSGLGGVPGVPHVPACCPEGLDGLHFYSHLSYNTRFFINATYYGHADILSESLVHQASASHFCATVTDSELHPFSDFRNLVNGAMTAFTNSIFSSCQIEYLIDAEFMPTDVNLFFTVAYDESSSCFASAGSGDRAIELGLVSLAGMDETRSDQLVKGRWFGRWW